MEHTTVAKRLLEGVEDGAIDLMQGVATPDKVPVAGKSTNNGAEKLIPPDGLQSNDNHLDNVNHYKSSFNPIKSQKTAKLTPTLHTQEHHHQITDKWHWYPLKPGSTALADRMSRWNKVSTNRLSSTTDTDNTNA